MRVHELSVIGGNVGGTSLARSLPTERDTAGRGIASIVGAALNNPESGSGVSDRPSMRTNCILSVRDGDDAGATNQTHRRFDGGDAIGIAGTNNAAIGLTA